MRVDVVSYNPQWPASFVAEELQLRSALDNCLLAVHHIGSTSVVGLAAKPIIDIMLEVSSLERLDEQNGQLEALGYEAMGECGIARRRYFRKGGDERTHQIHAFLQGDDHVHRHLAFRDYLRAHPAVCREYAELKQAVAASCQHDIERYCAGKNAFVKEHEANALRWLAGQEPAL
ncbi:GrpB family protein [Aeromonas veronii]|uniref:GrpB family protein n=1 Tax=Aeromonas veronii TaxID=654 RepID=UPI00191FB21C|nr:GrpB family protein [Aeromonas veronii]MBL0454162.1 GrpB family protein [Aeromonas veronii]HDZ8979091.1 GrpB family protein [Aeromonas veronii]HEA3125181.1 GrpB family protein [Aeromonas veronii]